VSIKGRDDGPRMGWSVTTDNLSDLYWGPYPSPAANPAAYALDSTYAGLPTFLGSYFTTSTTIDWVGYTLEAPTTVGEYYSYTRDVTGIGTHAGTSLLPDDTFGTVVGEVRSINPFQNPSPGECKCGAQYARTECYLSDCSDGFERVSSQDFDNTASVCEGVGATGKLIMWKINGLRPGTYHIQGYEMWNGSPAFRQWDTNVFVSWMRCAA
jgi:hypothetical protein